MNALAISFNTKDNYSRFVSAMAHEMRNPLANINLSAEMLQVATKEKEPEVYLDIIFRNSKRINELVIELLTYRGSEELQAREFSLRSLLSEVLAIVGDRIKLKNISVNEEYNIEDCNVILDGPKIKIALTNIIVNAIEAMIQDRGLLNLVLKPAYGKYILQIEDNGCGISRENLAILFIKSFTNKPGGLGLGLPIIYDTLRANNVSVNVESEEGKGTVFTLLFDKNGGDDNLHHHGNGTT